MKRFVISFVLSVAAFPACGEAPGEDRPPHTMWVARSISDCYQDYYVAGLQCQVNDLECEMDPTSAACSINCVQQREDSFIICLENIKTNNECWAELELDDLNNSQKDSDGDGILDRFEIPLELDPCNPCTYPTGPCDGELDSNGDGIPNNDPDTGPGCGDNCYM